MLATFDYTGAAALVAAFGGIIASVLAFLAQAKARTAANHTQAIVAAVSTPNGYTVGELAERGEARAHDEPEPDAKLKDLSP